MKHCPNRLSLKLTAFQTTLVGTLDPTYRGRSQTNLLRQNGNTHPRRNIRSHLCARMDSLKNMIPCVRIP